MTNSEYKNFISSVFGFSPRKIVLLEASTNRFGKVDYIMFDVCGVEYQAHLCSVNNRYQISIYHQF